MAKDSFEFYAESVGVSPGFKGHNITVCAEGIDFKDLIMNIEQETSLEFILDCFDREDILKTLGVDE